MRPQDLSDTLSFECFELDRPQRLLHRAGQRVELGARAFDLLCFRVEGAGRLRSNEELLDRVWSDVVVEEANLLVQISALGKMLGRDAIATVPGRGYRLCWCRSSGATWWQHACSSGISPVRGRRLPKADRPPLAARGARAPGRPSRLAGDA
jgi:hypothetical protein